MSKSKGEPNLGGGVGYQGLAGGVDDGCCVCYLFEKEHFQAMTDFE